MRHDSTTFDEKGRIDHFKHTFVTSGNPSTDNALITHLGD